MTLDRLRAREFPWTLRADLTFLNHASTGPLPQRALDALTLWGTRRAEPWRITLEEQFGILVRAREYCARLIGSSPDEIALMVNTTYGINLAARALPMAPGEIVVSSDREFPANIYPWMALEKSRGVKLQLVPCRDRLADEEALLKAIEQPGVRVLTVSWVSFETGKRLDLMRLGKACRDRGIFFVVDAIQGVGAIPIDVKACHIDILANGAQKWLLSPWGTGFVYVREELITQLEPPDTGWLTDQVSLDFTNFLDYKLEFANDARRFEVITLPFCDFAGMNGALEVLFELGLDRVHALVRARADQIVRWADQSRDVRLLTPADPEARAGIVAVIPPDPVGTSQRLQAAGVAHSLREGAIRLSPHFYTSEVEVDRALQLIAR